MTVDAAAQPDNADARLAAIRDRSGALRGQAAALSIRAQQAALHSTEVREASRRGCNHAAEAAAMRAELDVVAHELEGLRVAMDTRGVIEQAKGMLMLQHRCDADAAFSMLVSLSQTSHTKLVEVARAVVATWAGSTGAET